MANELLLPYRTGLTLYALLFDGTGQVWDGAAFVSPLAADWADYALPLAETAGTGLYRGDAPGVPARLYGVQAYRQAGGAPAAGDRLAGSGEWDSRSPASQASVDGLTTELAKVPREGETYRHHNVTTDATADVLIEAVP